MRLFISINFDDEIKKILKNSILDLKNISYKGNFTREENLHLTLVFIGEVYDDKVIKKIMDEINFETFNINLSSWGKFNKSQGDIYFIKVDKSKELSIIYQSLFEKLTNQGFKIDKRLYTPHITLGRQVKLKNDFFLNFPKTKVPVSKISLMKSERIDGKLIYTQIYCKEAIN